MHESLELLADSGYQGLSKLHEKSRTPQKKPRKGELSSEQKRGNRELARRRVVVKHVISLPLKEDDRGRVMAPLEGRG